MHYIFSFTKIQNLPLEASGVSQGKSHQSKKQEDLHVGSEADLAPDSTYNP